MNRRLFFIILINSFLIGCVTTYRVADLRVHAYEMNQVLEASLSDINKDLSKKTEIIENLKINSADFKHYPFNQLLEDYKQLLDIKSKIQKQVLEFNIKLQEIEALEKDKKQVRKNDEEFKIVTDYKSFTESLKSIFDKMFDDYKITSSNFNKTTNTNQIYMIDTKALQQQMNVLRNQVERSIKTNSIQMQKIDDQLKVDKKTTEKSRRLSEMKGLIKQIQSEVGLVQKAAQELHKSVSAKGRVVIGPHMKSHAYLLEIKTHGLNIDTMVKRFNDLNENLRD